MKDDKINIQKQSIEREMDKIAALGMEGYKSSLAENEDVGGNKDGKIEGTSAFNIHEAEQLNGISWSNNKFESTKPSMKDEK